MPKAFRSSGTVALMALAAVLCALPAAAQQKVGVSSAVNPDVSGTPPGGGMRRLVIGQEVLYNERITTTGSGQTQILFLDESSMTIGPNSDVTIDRFVYNPQTGGGQMAVTQAKGVLRYVGGKLSKQDNGVTVHTSTATIGVRGGTFLSDANGPQVEVIFIYGKEVQVTGQSGCAQTLHRPSYETRVGQGGCPTTPSLAATSTIAGLLSQLNGLAGQTGGARTVPTNATVAASGIGNTISGNLPASIQQAQQTQVMFAPPQVNVAALQTNLSVNTVQATGQPQIALSQSGLATAPTSAPTIPTPTATLPLITAFQLPAQGSSSSLVNTLPFFLNDEGLVDPSPTISPLYVVQPSGVAVGDTSTPNVGRTLQASLSIVGSGPGQQSALMLNLGVLRQLPDGTPVIAGLLRGTNVGENYTSAVSSTVGASGTSLTTSGGQISGFTLNQNQYTVNANGTVTGPFAATANETEGPSSLGSSETYTFTQPATLLNGTGTPPAGVGVNRTTQTLTGFFGGTMATSAATPVSNFTAGGSSYGITGTLALSTDATANTVTSTFTSNPLSPSLTGGVSSIVMSFGGQQSTFVDDNTFGAAEDPKQPQQINGQTLAVGGDPSQGGKLFLVSSGTIPAPSSFLPPGSNGNLCNPGTCQYLQWGYWGGDLQSGSSLTNLNRIDHGDINFFVAGVQTPVSQMPTSGVGSYAGTALGSVVNQGSMYVASGGFAATYNFGNGQAMAQLINFDKNINLTLATQANPALVGKNGFAAAGNIGNFNASIQGGFFGTGANAASEIAGNFGLQSTSGPSYLASGIFGGKLTGPIH